MLKYILMILLMVANLLLWWRLDSGELAELLAKTDLPFLQNFFENKKVKQSAKADLPAEFLVRIAPDVNDAVSLERVWIPYYFRHKDVNNVERAARVMLETGHLEKKYSYFFTELFRRNPDQLRLFRNHLDYLSKNAQSEAEVLLQNIEKVEIQVYPINDVQWVWARYAATGDIKLVDDLLTVLSSGKPEFTEEFKQEVAECLLGMSRSYYPVNETLKFARERFDGPQKQRIVALQKQNHDGIYLPSYTLFMRGKSCLKVGKLKEAKNLFLQALSITPDYPWLYLEIGKLLARDGKNALAIQCYLRAKQSMPIGGGNMPYLLYEMASLYNNMEDSQNTLAVLKESYALQPDDIQTILNLASVYDYIGDLKNAEKYFNKVLISKDRDANKVEARKFFERHKLPIPEYEQTTHDLLFAGKFDELENRLQELFVANELDEDGYLKSSQAFRELIASTDVSSYSMDQTLKVCKKWVQEKPESHFAHTILGGSYFNFAWVARGSGYVNTVTEEAWKLFYERLKVAGEHFAKAYQLNNKNSYAAGKMISVAKLSREPTSEDMHLWFERAVAANAIDPDPYDQIFIYLLPQWGGSKEEMLSFAREAFRNAPPHSLVPLELARAHWRIYAKADDADYFKNPTVWKEVKTAYERVLSDFPRSERHHNWYARSACLAGDMDVLRRQIATLGENWSEDVWGTGELYEKCRAQVQ